jgi:hypothetical protein
MDGCRRDTFIVISPYGTTKSPSAMTLLTVNFGGSMFPIDAIYWRMASFPFTVLSPTIVQTTSST